jgi:mRNA interferase HigB
VHVISRKALKQFWARHPDSKTALVRWHKAMAHAEFASFDELRAAFPSADLVEQWVVFNIGGNKYHLITSIHFNRGKVYIRDVLTHQAYSREEWKR